MLNLSVIIITKNEADCIRRCLESVKWATEIIVYDNNSQDETVAICREYTPHVFITEDWPGYGAQKNRALAKAQCEWVLSLDADEYLSAPAQVEIQTLLSSEPLCDAYEIPFVNYFCGKAIRHGDWGHHRVLRLFNREKRHITDYIVHEGVRTSGKMGRLKNPVFHDSFASLEEAVNKMNLYTSLTAKMRQAKGKRSSIFKAVTASSWVFFRSYLLRLGFLDGNAGFLHATYLAQNSFYRHIKTMSLKS
jgi:glycosyltransferase involved in cell wall biosynthesis